MHVFATVKVHVFQRRKIFNIMSRYNLKHDHEMFLLSCNSCLHGFMQVVAYGLWLTELQKGKTCGYLI